MILLTPELLSAYPTVKVILTTRDPASWRRSVERTVLHMSRSRKFYWLSYFSADCAAMTRFMYLCDRKVRAIVPADRLLEFKMGQDGWGELCDFLGTEVPEGDFLKLNTSESGSFHEANDAVWRGMALGAFEALCFGSGTCDACWNCRLVEPPISFSFVESDNYRYCYGGSVVSVLAPLLTVFPRMPPSHISNSVPALPLLFSHQLAYATLI